MEHSGLLFNTIKKTLKHSFIYGLGNSLTAVVGVVLIPLYTRVLSPDQYGIYSLISIVLTLLAFIYDFGMINALFRWVYHYSEEELSLRKRVASTALIFMLCLASVVTLVLWKQAFLISQIIFNNQNFVPLIRLMLIAIFLQSLTWVPLSLLRIKEKPVMFITIAGSGMAIMVLFNFIFLSSGMGIRGIYQAYIISYVCMLAALYYVTRNFYAFDFSIKELKGMLKFGLPFFPVLFFSWIIDFSGRYFLGKYSSLQQVGLYSIGYKIGQVLYLAEKTFAIAWVPLMLSLSQRYSDKAPLIVGRVFTYFIFASAFLFLACSIFSKEILKIFTSPAYYGAYKVVPIIALSYLLYGVYIYMLSGITITKNVYAQPFIFLAAAILNVILNITLIPRFNMIGAAFAALASYLLIAGATYYYSQKYYPIPIEFNRILKIFLTSAIILASGSMIAIDNLAVSIGCKAALLAGFFYILYVCGFFQPAELDKLKLIVTRKKRI